MKRPPGWGAASHLGRVISMQGEKQGYSANPLICRKADRNDCVDASAMSSKAAVAAANVHAMLCPACARSMTHAHTIWRAFQEDLEVLECRACNASATVKVPQKKWCEGAPKRLSTKRAPDETPETPETLFVDARDEIALAPGMRILCVTGAKRNRYI
jgi:hypothetical protein